MNKKEAYIRSIRPYPPQEEFFKATARRVAYGGARGGGKSYAMRTKLVLLALRFSGIQILLLRRTFPELRENHINPLRRILKGIAVYREGTKEFIFDNSSRIKLGYLADESDVLQYQGQAYDCIGMEEATQFTYTQYLAMTECCRVSGCMKESFVPRMYFTCNPGGVGHGWMKRLFIDREFRDGEDPGDYVFIPSTVYDNKFIMQRNPEYIKTLKSLPPLRRKAMLEGDWNVFEGQYFSEFSESVHVVKPFSIPDNWTRFAAFDYGLDMTACLWLCYPPEKDSIFVYRELYEPDLICSEAAKRIKERSGGEKLKYIAASPDLAGRRQDSGLSGFDIMSRSGLSGLVPADNDRIAGWRRIREFLRPLPEGGAALGIFPCCVNLIRTLPKLTFDPVKTEDAASSPHEYTHAPDALRYALMSAPFFPSAPQTKKPKKLTIEEQFFGERKKEGFEGFFGR